MAQAYIDDGPAGGNKMMEKFDAVAANIGEMVDPFLEATQDRANALLLSEQESLKNAQLMLGLGAAVFLFLVGFAYFMMFKALSFLRLLIDNMKPGSRYFCGSLFWASKPKQAANT
ncbi:hypothetical protein [Candidatus Reidiella endopervernicosa]|uniref:Uncharacterized protein n=1 Tax=Candidatus Reidiella endopervernicosa TaxID=2738883 RepID=A0A6N0HZN2_9GAMM|nr:hypothetical protein [Candidatus Reidiella endopervernicosa]QKQ27789.1 hypothetical protein HUE57_16995 [Candidatus Reidiella endopervernicosa]